MANKTTVFVCSSCGYESTKWYGRCPECGNWNTMSEFKVTPERKSRVGNVLPPSGKLIKISDVVKKDKTRISSGFEEFDRVLGGGLVPGEVVLLSGDPGIGKSTLLLQIALNLGLTSNILYVSGEESDDQILLRAERLISQKELQNSNLLLISTSDIDQIAELITAKKPQCVIIDSIQTMHSQLLPGFPGSIPQIRYCTQVLVEAAKSLSIPIFLVGHVTKEGIVGGPMLLSHMVDAVMYLEGERFSGTRILRSYKNRFGDISEVGIFTMEEKGLVQIADASTYFLDKNTQNVPGSCIAVVIEGSRPILVELQSLTVPSSLSFPRRVVSGISEKRVELLLAVIQKQLRLPIEKLDVFVNVIGGLKIQETATDLAVILAIVSSFKNKSLPKTAAISEVGLLGELRRVSQLEKRIKEAQKFGIKKIFTSKDFKYLSNMVQSMNRELKEELGVEIAGLRYFGSFFDEYLFKGVSYNTISFLFEGKIGNEAISPQDDISEIVYVRLNAIPFDRLAFESVKKALRKYSRLHL